MIGQDTYCIGVNSAKFEKVIVILFPFSSNPFLLLSFKYISINHKYCLFVLSEELCYIVKKSEYFSPGS